ncbi:MAG: efflux RND transporter periplasmic adaptor subunit [Desulfobacteraceae bacterium]
MTDQKAKIYLSIILCILVLLSAASFMIFMIKNKKTPEPVARTKQPAPVETFEAEKTGHRIKLALTGTVNSFSKAMISTEVSGKIIEINPKVKKGNYLKENEFLFKTDPSDYEVLVKKSSSLVKQAEAELQILKSEASSAQNEWEIFNKDIPPPNSLVFKIPQIKAAEARLAFLRAELLKAEKDLSSTRVYSPFDAVILEENIEKGVFATRGQSLLTLIKADEREFIFPVSINEINLITDKNKKLESESIKITIPNSGFSFKAGIKGMLPDTDNNSKMYKIMAEAADLYKNHEENSFLLAENSFITGTVYSKTIEDCFIVPSESIRKNSTVWILDKENRLEIKNIQLLYHDHKNSVIKGDFNHREKFITSLIDFPVSGMSLREINYE